ncbi:helix-turn-helix domain-containing protein [Nonomuraea aurantiaca]|uniref:helix-turn-helix domain-containing protein n=1 Tax=Nonomuraea aurantiaca TaxID=2878562 RepID=UPI001CDA0C53|nr:helix-turn-helix domain-containing protein [Nonomuraea aurantiaca]MCA2223401.1 helix-turn-helix domain-containing protein [Nonomuraea aurantiaca]
MDGALLGTRRIHVREPDTTPTVAFRTVDGAGRLYVLGPRTRASYLAPKDVPHCVTVRLRPATARPLLGVPLSELVDRVVPLRDLWGVRADRLAEELAGMVTGSDWAEQVMTRLEAAFLDRLSAQSPADLDRAGLVGAAAALLSAEAALDRNDLVSLAAAPPVVAVARELGVSERHLRNLFTGGVGVPPKRFARISRVRGVLARVCREEAASLAADAGYYDQSHMTAEFREVMGVPPSAYRAGRLPVPGTCSAG